MPNSRSKGIRGELEVAKMFRRWFPKAERSILGQTRRGYEFPDIVGGVEEHFFVEVKRYKKLTLKQLTNHWKKALSDAEEYSIIAHPVAYKGPLPTVMVWRVDRSDWRVWMDYENELTWQEFSDLMDAEFGLLQNKEVK